MVKRLSHPMHIGLSSLFNKKEMSKKRMANVQSGHHSFFLSVFSEDKDIHSFSTGNIFIQFIFWELSPTQTATVLIYIYLCVVLGLRMG